MSDQLPGGRGERFGRDAGVDADEALDVRRRLSTSGNGWLLSTVGETVFGHADVTAVIFTASQLGLYYIPARTQGMTARAVRISVAVAVLGATFRSAIYVYDKAQGKRRFTKIAGTEAVFPGDTVGLVQVTLPRDVPLAASDKLFIARWASDPALAVEGYQSGAGTAPRVVRTRALNSVTPPLGAAYGIEALPIDTGMVDTPLIAYLSPDAAEVL